MFKISWSNLKSHIGRLIASMMAIALGVAFVVGIMGFASAIKNALITSLASQDQNISVIVAPKSSGNFSGFADRRTIPFSTLNQITQISGVKAIYGQIDGPAVILDSHNKPFGSSGLAVSNPDSPLFKMYPLVTGSYPKTNNQVDVDQITYRALKLSLGRSIRFVSISGTPRTFVVVGEVVPPATRAFNSGSFALFTPAETKKFTQATGYTRIDVIANPSVSDTSLRNEIISKIGQSYSVLTGAQAVSAEETKVISATSIIETALLIFAVVAIFVASLVIVNTFRVLVAQRIRQLALLRCVGASKLQVFKLLIYESVLVGLIASLGGIVVGFGLSNLIVKIITASTPSMSSLGVAVTLGPILYGLLVGIFVTVASSLFPIYKATKVAPVEALRIVGEARVTPKTSVFRLIVMIVFFALGLLIIVGGLNTSNAALIATFGGVFIFIGVIVSMPFLVKPMVSFLSFPLKIFGTAIKIGKQNTFRNRNRTAITASALTIGLMLVSLVAVIFYSFSGSVTAQLTKDVPFSYIVSTGKFKTVVPLALVNEFEKSKYFDGIYTESDNVAIVKAVSKGDYTLPKNRFNIATPRRPINTVITRGISTVSYDLFSAYGLKAQSGSLLSYNSGKIIISSSVSKAMEIGIGGVIEFTSETGNITTGTVGAIMQSQNIASNIIVPQSTMNALYTDNGYNYVFLKQSKGISTSAVVSYIQNKSDSYPLVTSENLQTFISNITGKIAVALDIFTALLGFALFIAFIGIANTLSLSVIERTQEFGLLKALGFTKSQIGMTMIFEGFMTSLMGSLIGIILGVIGGYGVIKSISSASIIFSIPWGNLGVYLLVAAVAGVFASLLPARRASRLAPTEAMAQIG